MLNHATITTGSGEIPLSYGVYAARLFCQRLRVDPIPSLILQQFLGRQYPQALAVLIIAGTGQAAKANHKPCMLTEFDAMELADELGAPTVSYLINCLLGSLIDCEPAEVDAWFAQQSQKADEKPKKEASGGAKEKTKPFDWEELQRYAYGEMGLSTHELLFSMSLAQYSYRVEGYAKKQNRLWEEDWRQTRTIAILLRNAHFKQPTTPEKYLPLPGDKLREETEKKSDGVTVPPDMFIGMFTRAFGGNVVEKKPDGTVIITTPTGATKTTTPDGKVTRLNADGTPYQPKKKPASTPLQRDRLESYQKPPNEIITPAGNFFLASKGGEENEPPFAIINNEKKYRIQDESGGWGAPVHSVKPIRNEQGLFVLPDTESETKSTTA